MQFPKHALCATVAATSCFSFAQTQSPPVEKPGLSTTFYGVVDLSASAMDSGFGRKLSFGSSGFSASRFGARLDFPLEDDVKFVAVAEAGLHFDTGDVGNGAQALGINNTYPSTTANNGSGPQIFARQIYGGVSSTKLGTLTAGRQYSPSYILSGITGNLKNDGLYAYPGALLPIIGGMPARVNNSLLYWSPRLGGFSGVAMVTTGSENNVNGSVPVGSGFTTSRAGRGLAGR